MRLLRRLRAACLLALPVWPLLYSAAQSPPKRAPTPTAGAGALTVVFSGELAGHLTPCGCSSPMLGGVLRRATLLEKLAPRGASVLLENGDLVDGAGRQDEIKAETLIEMLSALGYDAIGLGEKDFGLGLPFLRALQARSTAPLLCANASDAQGKPLFAETAVVTRTFAGRKRSVLVLAVLSERLAAAAQGACPDARFGTPASALARLRARVAAHDGPRVLLYHGPHSEAKAAARAFPLFDLVVYAHGGPSAGPAAGARTAFAWGGESGKQLGVAELRPVQPGRAGTPIPPGAGRAGTPIPPGAGQAGTPIPPGAGRAGTPILPGARAAWSCSVRHRDLGPSLADDATMALLKRAYLDRLVAEDLFAQMPRTPALSGAAYAGSEACAPCHAAAAKVWRASLHARATKTLADAHEDADPECIVCHAVGADREGGFAGAGSTPHLAGVGCESCHGAGAAHVRDPKRALGKVGLTVCRTCHVVQHSPRFSPDRYWALVRH